jgi:hypothetical protein
MLGAKVRQRLDAFDEWYRPDRSSRLGESRRYLDCIELSDAEGV